ncbi:hypothetical protein XA68_15630 [Ophiocordyceps unilateralis]|uniref:alpha-1,2-Mannosidase n=1 Tax=Ophiocordyceps unilateralis TaxID=268505 RepID=A0A2A9PKS7_OPHUN|nr:hypothetical protein XA68_15630 [Ophiocordyceps unilateralis]
MLRRKYRLFSVCALVIIFLLYRLSKNSPQPHIATSPARAPPSFHPGVDEADFAQAPAPYEPKNSRPDFVAKQEPKSGRVGPGKSSSSDTKKIPKLKNEPDGTLNTLKHGLDGDGPKAKAGLRPNKDVVSLDTAARDPITGDKSPPLTWKKPPKHSDVDKETADASDVHWIKPKEHFPLPKESIITLPTAAAMKLPKIQFNFGPESAEAKAKRLQRQKRVKTELERSWSGYKKHAWLHDELSPVSGGYRDPFCGWAATLVDSLDTLWIAGMKDEFDKAVEAVETIDFTRAARSDIPVFETTIRYLGGLIAAFDISGGARGGYSILLDKAVELAEILMGIFDTPNRMPVLFYQWKPEYASQPHIASQGSMAELATLSLEFTRLAQLTAQHKYYDAVDRITNALVDMQKEGTLVPGLFPENVDLSGCNRTATRLQDTMSYAAKQQIDAQGFLSEPKGFGEDFVGGRDEKGQGEEPLVSRLDRRDDDPNKASFKAPFNSKPGREGPYKADGIKAQWDCVPQGLVPGGYGAQTFHMGGGQDSAYEYFGKEYQLLRGREPKYRKLYEETADAVEKYLLYRPMIEGQWDVLFPAKVGMSPRTPDDLTYDYVVSHLACFIGGMFGLGGKLFSRPEDVETAKKLTDGCVWAYQASASGIMPDSAKTVPCPSLDRCEFNKTQWWEALDPSKSWREEQVQLWEQKYGSASEAAPVIARSGGVQKRAAVGLSDGLKGSQLPESLRIKLGKKLANHGSQAKMTDGSTLSEGASTAVADDSTREDAGAKEQPEPHRPKRPLSHEEFVEMLIEQTKLPRGFLPDPSAYYLLRPEAIESVWYMYRITGDPTWMDKGWRMFEATVRATRTSIANSAVSNVLSKEPSPTDEMESFWIAETLKYYYLLFSEPEVISLDEWVLNTEAHPFRL